VALGDFTQLNTVEYKYYGFFNRIRLKLEQFWGRSLKDKAEALYKSGRRLPASDQYVTSLVITMSADGQIIQVQVKSSSGVRELDDAAIDSFKAAGPFPNPPQGLIVDGKATIEWGFVVKS
jgi:protein TonB